MDTRAQRCFLCEEPREMCECSQHIQSLRAENAELKARAELADKYEKALGAISAIENKEVGGDWDEIEEARRIAKEALQGTEKK